jgi:hypothetical protein
MGRLSAAMLAELRSPSPDIHPLLEIEWPSGTKRYARTDDGIASRTLGGAVAEVVSFGSISRSIRDRACALQSWATTVELRDSHFDIANIFALYDCLNTPARIYLASANVVQASWFKVCEGVIIGFEESAPRVWSLSLGPNERPLRSPLLQQRLTPAIFSTLPTETYGTYLPLIFGRHDTSGEVGKGKLGTIWVGNTGSQSQHVLCLGAANIQRVYDGGVKLATSTYTITYPVQAGLQVTLITFTTDRSTKTITVDASGYTNVAVGANPDASLLYQKPGETIRLLLNNFAYQSWHGGIAWYDTSSAGSPIDDTAFNALDAATARGLGQRVGGVSYVASRFIDGQSTGLAELNSWASSHEVKVFWRNDGLLSCILDDPAVYPTSNSPWLQRDRCREFTRSLPTDSLAHEVDVSYGLSFSNAVQDTRSRSDAVDGVDMPWGPAFE